MLPVKGVENIDTAELKQMVRKKGKQFIDVRTPGEYKMHHIKQFKNIPLQQLAAKSNQLNPEKETVLICQSGMRSMQAARILKKAGFTKLINVKGGMNTWRP